MVKMFIPIAIIGIVMFVVPIILLFLRNNSAKAKNNGVSYPKVLAIIAAVSFAIALCLDIILLSDKDTENDYAIIATVPVFVLTICMSFVSIFWNIKYDSVGFSIRKASLRYKKFLYSDITKIVIRTPTCGQVNYDSIKDYVVFIGSFRFSVGRLMRGHESFFRQLKSAGVLKNAEVQYKKVRK
jgi:hypothetical protein